jgi:hypothetical protein
MEKKYLNKYKKYKNKYINLKSQFGGHGYEIRAITQYFFNNWSKITNSGQQNCGVFLSEEKPDKILICRGSIGKVDDLEYVQSRGIFFPILYNIYSLDDKYYMEYEKMEGDITSIFYSKIPQEIANSEKYVSNKEQLLYFFDLKIKTTMNNGLKEITIDKLFAYLSSNLDKINDIESKFEEHNETNPEYSKFSWQGLDFYRGRDYSFRNNFENSKANVQNIIDVYNTNPITSKLFDEFVSDIIEKIVICLPDIIKGLTILQLKLIEETGYCYADNKFDNYAYKRIGSENKYFFIDEDSGLHKINSEDLTRKLYIRKLIREYNYKYAGFNINGQYNLYNNFLDNFVMFDCSESNEFFKNYINNLELYNIITCKKTIEPPSDASLPLFTCLTDYFSSTNEEVDICLVKFKELIGFE